MIKVLQIGMCSTLGGIESYLINYTRHIDRKKIRFDFISMESDKLCFQDELISYGCNVYKLPNYKKNPIKYICELVKIIKKNKYDVVHYNMNSAVFLYPLISAKIANVKVRIAHAHNSSNDKGIIKSIIHNINRHLIPIFANDFFACSQKAGKWFFSNKILKSKSFYIINNGIDVDKFKFDENKRNLIREKLKIKNDEILIGHVGRFYKQKNHVFLINILEKTKEINKKIKLVLIGNGPLKNEIINTVNKLNLQEWVIFLEPVDNIYEYYNAFDIFILPSLYEGLPLVGVEAQCSGCLCLFSDNITKELKITKNVEYISLNSMEKWKERILHLDFNDIDRNSVKLYDYDIKNNAKKLAQIYITLKRRKGADDGER